jgi:hypothetical protein
MGPVTLYYFILAAWDSHATHNDNKETIVGTSNSDNVGAALDAIAASNNRDTAATTARFVNPLARDGTEEEAAYKAQTSPVDPPFEQE